MGLVCWLLEGWYGGRGGCEWQCTHHIKLTLIPANAPARFCLWTKGFASEYVDLECDYHVLKIQILLSS